MASRVCVAVLVLGLLYVGSTQVLYAQEQKGSTDVLKGVVELIYRGEWKSIFVTARELVAHHPNNASLQYVADAAADVLGDHTRTSLTKYDLPYSDDQAMRNVQSWARSLLVNDPKNLNLLILNGMLHSPKGDGDTGKFVEYLEQARAIDAKNNFVLEALGSAYGARGNYVLAVQSLNKAIEIKPTSTAYTNLGVAFLKQSNTIEAEKYLRKGVELDSNDAAAWFNLGSYYAERNRASEAKPALEKAVELSPKNMDARWNLGGIYFNSGQRSKAVVQLKDMIRIAPGSPLGRQAKQMLSQLGE
jgi:tetratricopeptide (TPR) repeat protein